MNRLSYLEMLALAVLLAGCASLYQGVVTLTEVVEGAAKDYARLYNDGLVSPEVAAKASAAYAEWNKAAGVARRVFEAVKAGQGGDTRAALEAARVAANHFVDVIFPVLPPSRGAEVRALVAKAGAP